MRPAHSLRIHASSVRLTSDDAAQAQFRQWESGGLSTIAISVGSRRDQRG